MSGENRVLKRKNRFHRGLAVVLAFLLMVGQSHIPAFALEEPVSSNISNPAGEITDINDAMDDSGINDSAGNGKEESSANIGSGIDNSGMHQDSENKDDGNNKDENHTGAGNENIEDSTAEKSETNGGDTNEEEKAFEEIEVVETVSGNEILAASSMEIPGADGGVEAYASDPCVIDHIKYEVLENHDSIRSVEIAGFEEGISDALVIPAQISFNGEEWDVTSIAQKAFYQCQSLVSVEIPGSVQSIGGSAFAECSNLKRVVINNGLKKIQNNAFGNCKNLEYVKIPDSVNDMNTNIFAHCVKLKSVDFPQGMTGIPDATFASCYGLEEINIPNTVSKIGSAFEYCINLYSIDIPQSVQTISVTAFDSCQKLKYMKIAVDADHDIKPIIMELYSNFDHSHAFWDCPDERYIVFMNADGTQPLSGDALDRAKEAYLGDVNDGNASDDKWYGWQVGDLPVKADTYTVTVHVYKDGVEWPDHDRVFALRSNNGTEFITDLKQVKNGTYNIYDITRVNPDSYWSKSIDTGIDVHVDGVDTEVTVTVQSADTEAMVKYYTVTFYDGPTAYGSGTSQEPQLILDGKQVRQPDAPGKAGHQFAGWKTQDGGSTAFDFHTAVTTATNIYASWTVVTGAVYTITAVAGTGGRITPADYVAVNEGAEQSFSVTPDNGYRIKSVAVDGTDVTAIVNGANGIYTFTNVRENHRIEAVFEADGSNSGGEDKPGSGGDTSGGNTGSSAGSGSGGTHGGDSTEDNTNLDDVNISDDTDNAGAFLGETGSEETVIDNGDNNAIVIDENNVAGNEPKTGDTHQTEVYATVAMIAGLTYLLLYFTDKERGMTEEEKKEIVSALVRWARQGHRLRKYIAMMAIFCLLVYYHSIGKRIGAMGTELSF